MHPPTELRCAACATPADGRAPWRCAACGSPLELELPPPDPAVLADASATGPARYRGWLPPGDIESLGEPATPLVRLEAEGRPLLAKLEGSLPTGSFKDRGTAVTVGWLRARGVRELVVDSSGNAAASFAAYAARARIAARIFVPADASPAKLLQARAHGATVVSVPGSRAAAGDAARAALDGAGDDVAYASHLWQPAFLAGTATFAYELHEQLGGALPAAIVAPLGGGTLLLGVARGYGRLRDAGLVPRVPVLVGVQSAACAPLAAAFAAGADDAAPAEPGETIAEGIRIARPPRAPQILQAIRASGGTIVAVGEDRIVAATRALLARGLYLEPTSAAALAGVPAALTAIEGDGGPIVLALTGHGLKAAATIATLG